MEFPLFSGQVARLLGVPEPRLADLIRKGKVASPPLTGGRRLWRPHHVRQAATALGALTPEFERLLDAEVEVGSHG